MDKSVVESLTPEQRCKMAVAYLMHNKDERPEYLKDIFDKLDKSESAVKATNAAIANTREALNSLDSKFFHTLGAIDTLSELIAEDLAKRPAEEVNAWCEKYQPPSSLPSMKPGIDVSGHANNVPAGDIDIAGATSRT